MPVFTKTIPPKSIGVGQIETIVITNAGAGYVTAPTVSFNAPYNTTQATATCTISGGSVNSVTVTASGAGYGYNTYAPHTAKVTFSAAPSGGITASGIAVIDATGEIKSITITNAGAGYTTAPTITIAAPKVATPTATASINASGNVNSIVITSAGWGYTSTNPPVLTLSAAPSGGTTATATATIKEIQNLEMWGNAASAGQSLEFVSVAQAVLNDATDGVANSAGWWQVKGWVDSNGNHRVKDELLVPISS